VLARECVLLRESVDDSGEHYGAEVVSNEAPRFGTSLSLSLVFRLALAQIATSFDGRKVSPAA